MARGRMLSRSLGSSEKFYNLHQQLKAEGLGEFAGELYCLLIANHDDHGRLAGDAFSVKHACFPASERSVDEFDRALDALHDVNLIVRYVYNGHGKLAIQIVDHERHQDLQRRAPSDFPPPSADVLVATSRVDADLARALDAIALVLARDAQQPSAVTASTVLPSEQLVALIGGDFTAARLANALSKIGVYPYQQRIGDERVRGYDRDELSRLVTARHDSSQPVTAVTVEEKRREEKRTEEKLTSKPSADALAAAAQDASERDALNDASFELRDVTFDEPASDQPPPAATSSMRAKSGRGRKPTTAARRARAQQLVELWRECCPQLTPVHALTEKRITAACARLDEQPNLEQWRAYFERLNASTFCRGSNGWRCDFEFALKPDSWVKTFEGRYDDKRATRVIRTADDARAALRERGVERVTSDADIDLR